MSICKGSSRGPRDTLGLPCDAYSTGAAWLFTIVLSTSQSAFGASQRSTPSPSQLVLLPRRFSAGDTDSGASVRSWRGGVFKALSPSRGTSRRPKRAAEPPGRVSCGKEAKCAWSGVVRARGRRPDLPWPARAVARGHTEALVALMASDAATSVVLLPRPDWGCGSGWV